jgi:hypothetical protein
MEKQPPMNVDGCFFACRLANLTELIEKRPLNKSKVFVMVFSDERLFVAF